MARTNYLKKNLTTLVFSPLEIGYQILKSIFFKLINLSELLGGTVYLAMTFFDLAVKTGGFFIGITGKLIQIGAGAYNLFIAILTGGTEQEKFERITDELYAKYTFYKVDGGPPRDLLITEVFYGVYKVAMEPVHELTYVIVESIKFLRVIDANWFAKIVIVIKVLLTYIYNTIILTLDYVLAVIQFMDSLAIRNTRDPELLRKYYLKHILNNKNIKNKISMEQWIANNGKYLQEKNNEVIETKLNLVSYVQANKKVLKEMYFFSRDIVQLKREEHHKIKI